MGTIQSLAEETGVQEARMLRSRGNRPGLPVACPVCSCERIDSYGRGINCVCHSCGEHFPRSYGIQAYRELMEPLTGAPDQLELGDVVEFMEDPEDRPYWIWDI